MPRGRSWTEIEVNRLIALRDDERLIWSVIARKLGRSAGADGGVGQCCAAYRFHTARRTRRAAMIAAGLTPSARRVPRDNYQKAKRDTTPTTVAIEPVPVEVASPSAPARRRYFSDNETSVMARIAAQGLTAGYFGDPPPGRSALDQRQVGK